MDLKNNDFNLNNVNKEAKNNFIKDKNKENNEEDDVYFYIMTLQADGKRHQIKIFENSNASEIAFNFCKTYNLDFSSMKYIKRCLKQILFHFNSTKRNEMINILKSNSSIQEVTEEEIITDNSLKKSCSLIKNNSNSLNINNEENKIKKDNSKKNIISLLSDKTNITNNSNKNKKFEPKCICQKLEDKNKKIKNDITKSKNNENDEGKNTLKDYSLETHLENESVENFPPTQHTTKIEQKSQNSYTLNQKNNCDIHNKRNNSKNKKIQLNNLNNNSNSNITKYNSNIIKYNKINKR
jgi:hypothetical protein